MPAKKVSARSAAPRKTRSRSTSVVASMSAHAPMMSAPKVCRSCNTLPAGSVELVSLLLVLVFSLSAVLLTSGFALQKQANQIEALETQVAV